MIYDYSRQNYVKINMRIRPWDTVMCDNAEWTVLEVHYDYGSRAWATVSKQSLIPGHTEYVEDKYMEFLVFVKGSRTIQSSDIGRKVRLPVAA